MTRPKCNFVIRRCRYFVLVFSCLTLFIVNAGASPVDNYMSETGLQQQVIKGVITDEKGNPFPFATVYVEGTTSIGTTANAKGEYQITVPPGSTLCFAFVGYKTQKLPIGNAATLNVKMELDVQNIEEIVVVGMREQNKTQLSVAVATVKADKIVASPVANISNALAGRLPGLTSIQASGQPGYDQSTLTIRGVGSWNSSAPLYVIDGVERTSLIFSTMNAEEIESISILKDAAATSVYGSKGANGVLIVTTKRGQLGAPSITFTASTTVAQFTRYPKFLDSYESLKLFNEARVNDNLDPVYTEAELQKFKDGSDPYRYPNTDWYNLLTKPYAPQYRGTLSLRGGTRTVKYYFSGSYMKQEGQFKTSQGRVYNPEFAYRTYRFTSNIDAMITNTFTLSFELGGTLSDEKDPYNDGVIDNMNRIGSWYMPAKNPNGTYAGTSEFQDSNPLWALNTNGVDQRLATGITSAIKLDFNLNKFIKGLNLTTRVAFDSNFGNNKYWSETQSTYRLVSREGRADRYQSFLTPVYFGSSTGTLSPTRTLDAQAVLVYAVKFNNHSLRFQGVSNISETLYSTNLPIHSVSFVVLGNYTFKSKYNLQLNLPYRGSENFAPGRRFGFFPAVSASWNVNEEPFIKQIRLINMLKARISYGKTGSDYVNTRFLYKEGKWTTGTGNYAFFGTGAGSSRGYATEPSIANPLATWESAYILNFGFDLAILKNKISVTFDRFFERREGILQNPNSTSGILGIGVPQLNIGKTSKNGYELEVTYNQKIGKDFDFSISPNIAFVANKVVFKDEPKDKQWWLKEEGKPIGQPFGYIVLGYFKDQEDINNSPTQQVGSAPIPGDFKYLDYDGNGVVNIYDQVPIGYTSAPRYTFGTTINLGYKAFDFSMQFQGGTQSTVYISQYLMWEFYNRAKVQTLHLGRWTPETAETATYPALHIGGVSQNHVSNSFWRKDNSYMRLKNINLGYTLPTKLVKKIGMKGMRVSVSGVNLITWDKLKVLDPETASGTTTNVYPQTKNYSFNLNINF